MSSPAEDGRAARTLTVAVLTYQRAELLPDLLGDLDRQAGLLESPLRIRLLVVDNDAAASARSTVLAQHVAHPLTYVVEQRRGIAAARNRVLLECRDADLLVFIDDDERPDDRWLDRLVQTFDSYHPAGVAGPVRTVYVGEPDAWAVAGGFIDRSHRDGVVTGTDVAEAATNNLLLDLRVVRRLGLSFQEYVGLSSGEDAIFTRQLTAAGGRIVWCEDAWVSDLRPASRTTKRALLRRAYSFSNAGVLVKVSLAPTRGTSALVRLRACLGGLARAGVGSSLLVLGTVTGSMRRRARGARLIARGCGALAACVGLRYEEYASQHLSRSTAADDVAARAAADREHR